MTSSPTPPRLVELPRFLDARGNLSSIQEMVHVPFPIARAYWIYDVPGGEKRGGHAYRRGEEMIVALSGSFDLHTESPAGEAREFRLNRSYYGVYVPPMTWRELTDFSTNSLALVLSSTPYDEADYIRSHDEFASIAATPAAAVTGSPLPDREPCHCPARLPLVGDCRLMELPRITDRAGNITPVHPCVDIPFAVRRVFYTYDIPGGESRGAHAHRSCHQLIVAASGSFDVELDDGRERRVVNLSQPYMALHVPPGIWASEQRFSSGSICLVLASEEYDEAEYIRSYTEFIALRHG